MDLLRQRDPDIHFKTACNALELARSTANRRMRGPLLGPARPRPPSRRALSELEKRKVIDVLHSKRFVDQTCRQVYAELLDDGVYIASVRTMYRLLAGRGETRERRNQRQARKNAIPRLEATAPNQVWTWDISKLPTHQAGVFLNLYLVLDLFSRYPVAWMVAERENSALAKQLIAEAYCRYGIEPDTLTLHNDRGAPMTSNGFVEMLGEMHVGCSVSRPRVSNDNPFSESCFKTFKQQPDYPGYFDDVFHARSWGGEFIDWYANHHRHSGLALFTPADVYFGRYHEVAKTRQQALDTAWLAHPERFVRGRPAVRLPAAKVTINPLVPESSARPLTGQPQAVSSEASMVPAVNLPALDYATSGATHAAFAT